MDVRVYGDWIPRNLFGSFHLLFAALKAVYLAFRFLCSFEPIPDLIIADQITFHTPLLRIKSKLGLLFYCHFPDKLLAPKSNDFVRTGIYRRLFDWAEEKCLAIGADKIVVNSKFTQNVFIKEFKSIKRTPDILYPGVKIKPKTTAGKLLNFTTFLSLNRFERKKDLNLAIEAFHLVDQSARLIIAGGFDLRVAENRYHLLELEKLCDKLKISYKTLMRGSYDEKDLEKQLAMNQILFLPSISDELKESLMKSCTALLYTPSNEHFGIVPIEAMSWGLPVIAIRSGGPKETVIDGATGYLCESNPKDMARCIELLMSKGKDYFSKTCRTQINFKFSSDQFTNQLKIMTEEFKIKK